MRSYAGRARRSTSGGAEGSHTPPILFTFVYVLRLFPRRGALAPPSWACHRLSLFPLLSFVFPIATVSALPSPLTAPAVCGTLAATFVRGGWRLRPAPPFHCALRALCCVFLVSAATPCTPAPPPSSFLNCVFSNGANEAPSLGGRERISRSSSPLSLFFLYIDIAPVGSKGTLGGV